MREREIVLWKDVPVHLRANDDEFIHLAPRPSPQCPGASKIYTAKYLGGRGVVYAECWAPVRRSWGACSSHARTAQDVDSKFEQNARICNMLYRGDVRELPHLKAMSDDEILCLRNCGKGSLAFIREVLGTMTDEEAAQILGLKNDIAAPLLIPARSVGWAWAST